MNLIRKVNFDINGVQDITYFCNGQQITFDQYVGIESDLFEEVDKEECDCEKCCGCDYEEQEQTENKGISVKLNVSLNQDDLEDILNIIDYLEEKLSNIKVKFSL